MVARNVPVSKAEIGDFCRRHHVRKLSVFGSVLREDFRPESDVDILVRFDPDHSVGFRIFDMEDELSRLFDGRRVDIVNEKFLNRCLRDRILSESVVQYDEG